MKKRIFSYFFVLLFGYFTQSVNGQFVSNGWVYLDGDEFNGTVLDLDKLWRPMDVHSLAKNRELQYYTDSGNFAFGQDAYAHYLSIITKRETLNNVLVIPWEDSLAEIAPDREPPYNLNLRNFNYTSGAIVTRQPYKYGCFEIRFKAPFGKGLWPAFWLRAYDEEIDIMELKGECPVCYHWAMHGPGSSANKCWTLQGASFPKVWKLQPCGGWIISPNFNFTSSSYTTVTGYRLPGIIMWAVNGIGQKYVLHEFVGVMRLIANMAVANDMGPFEPGPDQTTQFPAYFDIDYIRIWAPMDCNQNVLICNQLQNLPDPTVNTGRVITMGDGICTNVIMPVIGAIVYPDPPYFAANDVTHRDLIASERVVINPNMSILYGSDFTARISPCSEQIYTSTDTTGLFPIDSIEEGNGGGGESMQGLHDSVHDSNLLYTSGPPDMDKPFPTSPFFSMQNRSVEPCEIQIQDWQGNILIKKGLSSGEECQFNLINLQEGYYLLKTITPSRTTVSKIYLVK
jgi:hypothetical protein